MHPAHPPLNRTDLLNLDAWIAAARLLAASFLAWALAAGLLYWSSPALDTLPRLFVFTECVGMVFIVCVALLSRARLLLRMRASFRWPLTAAVSIPVGYFGGHLVASFILREPVIRHGIDYMVPFVLGLALAAFVIYFAATREQLAREAATRSHAQSLATESELRLLRAQLEPHMLFNSLANLRSLVREDAPQAERMIDQLIVYLRSALAASRDETTTLQAEFAQLRAYLEIMSLRMGPRLAFRLDLPASLERATIPPMLLQPLVEHAIKHGLEPKVGAGSIEVSARVCDAGFEVSVNDSGLGLPVQADRRPDPDATAGTYGLGNVRDRLKAIYGAGASLTLQARTPAGVCAVVRIPS